MVTRSKTALEFYNRFVEADDAGRREEAATALGQAVKLGEPMAHHVLAYNEFGKDSPRLAWALRHYRVAAGKGFAPSAWNLARYYDKIGRKALYLKWMRCTARLGDPDAVSELIERGYSTD